MRLEQAIGLSRGAIFNWFPSKEELFIALAARDAERLLRVFAEQGLEAILDALLRDDPDWLAVYLEFGRRLRTDEQLRERWVERARGRARAEPRRGSRRVRPRGACARTSPPRRSGTFSGVILDGIAVQRALGFEAPKPKLLHRLTRDAIGERGTDLMSD